MSMKNHTKNQLACITAKIKDLKRKYPVDEPFYSKENILGSTNPNQRNLFMNPSLPLGQKLNDYNKQRSVSEIKKQSDSFDISKIRNNKYAQNNYNIQNLGNRNLNKHSLDFRFHKQDIHNHPSYQMMDQKCLYANKQNHKPSEMHRHGQIQKSMQIQFNAQKPFEEYKKQMTCLKKQILDSLVFDNFQMSKKKGIEDKIFENQKQKDKFRGGNNVYERDNINHQEQSIQLSNKTSKYDTFEQKSLTGFSCANYKNLTKFNSQQQHKNHQSQSLQTGYSKTMIQRLSQQLVQFRQQISTKFDQIQQKYQTCISDNTKIAKQIQQMKSIFKKGFKQQSDFKVIQIQNQSMNKISKELNKEIENIYLELSQANQKIVCLLQNQKSQKQQPSFPQAQQLQTFLNEIRQKQQSSQLDKMSLKRLQQKMLRQIMDLKNQIQMVNQKAENQKYIEKTLRSLMPINNSVNQKQKSTQSSWSQQNMSKIKQSLLADRIFIEDVKRQIEESLSNRLKLGIKEYIDNQNVTLQQKINSYNSNLNTQISQLKRQIKQKSTIQQVQQISKCLKQCQTKMTSYSFIISNIQQTLKQSNQLILTENDKIDYEKDNQMKEMINNEIISLKEQLQEWVDQRLTQLNMKICSSIEENQKINKNIKLIQNKTQQTLYEMESTISQLGNKIVNQSNSFYAQINKVYQQNLINLDGLKDYLLFQIDQKNQYLFNLFQNTYIAHPTPPSGQPSCEQKMNLHNNNQTLNNKNLKLDQNQLTGINTLFNQQFNIQTTKQQPLAFLTQQQSQTSTYLSHSIIKNEQNLQRLEKQQLKQSSQQGKTQLTNYNLLDQLVRNSLIFNSINF